MTIQNATRKSQNILTALQCRSICGRPYARCVPGYVYASRPKFRSCLSELQSIPLPFKRQRLIALEVFKILTKQCPSYLNDLIKPLKDTGHNLRTKNVEPPHFKSIKYGKKSFSYSGSKLWNNLPPCLQQSNHFEHFKKQISSWDGTKCKCSMCKYDVA